MDFERSSDNTNRGNDEKAQKQDQEDREHWEALRTAGQVAASQGFECLYRRHRRGLIRVAATLYTRQDAGDVVDSLFGHLWADRTTLQAIHTSVRAYLYAAVRHAVSNVRRRDRRGHRNGARFALLADTPAIAGDVIESEESFEIRMARLVWANLECLLTRREFDAFTLQIDGFSYNEISQKLQISKRTVNTLLERARRRLRALCE